MVMLSFRKMTPCRLSLAVKMMRSRSKKVVKDMLLELADKIYNGPYNSEIWERIIDRTISNMQPYLKSKPVKV
jgi:hypothetical protein